MHQIINPFSNYNKNILKDIKNSTNSRIYSMKNYKLKQ